MLFNTFPKRAIIIAPHADDEVLGAGGFIARANQNGWESHVIYATVSGYSSEVRGDISTAASRQDEVNNVAKFLNFTSYAIIFADEDGGRKHLRLDTVPQTELIAFISHAIAAVKPSVAIIPCIGHYHQDHRAVAAACLAALRPAPDSPLRPFVPVVIAYGHAVSGWGGDAYSFKPNFFIDISKSIETKLEAIACYKSQLCNPPHPRSLSAIRDNCSSWGAFSGTHYAEPFECIRFVA